MHIKTRKPKVCVITHAETSNIRVSSLITMHSSLDAAHFPLYQQKTSCKTNDHGCKLDVNLQPSFFNMVDTPQTPRLPGVRSVLLMADILVGSGTIMLPPIFESTASTVNRSLNACHHEPRREGGSSSPTPSSSSCATEVHWARGSQTEGSTPSSTASNSASCDDKVRTAAVFSFLSRLKLYVWQEDDEEEGAIDSAPESSDAHPVYTGVSRFVAICYACPVCTHLMYARAGLVCTGGGGPNSQLGEGQSISAPLPPRKKPPGDSGDRSTARPDFASP